MRRELTIVLLGRTDQSEVALDDESTDFRWVSLGDIAGVPMGTLAAPPCRGRGRVQGDGPTQPDLT